MPESKRKTTTIVLSAVAAMFILAFASFPLYNLFCKVTGYGGTTQRADQASTQVGTKTITVEFNSDIAPDLGWHFKPEQRSVKVKTGENKLAFYSSENYTDKAITGMATYNVVPQQAGIYFNKIHCFCFDEQTLAAGEKVDMPVSFYIDPEIEKDPDLKDVDTITLSYTFFKVDN